MQVSSVVLRQMNISSNINFKLIFVAPTCTFSIMWHTHTYCAFFYLFSQHSANVKHLLPRTQAARRALIILKHNPKQTFRRQRAQTHTQTQLQTCVCCLRLCVFLCSHTIVNEIIFHMRKLRIIAAANIGTPTPANAHTLMHIHLYIFIHFN